MLTQDTTALEKSLNSNSSSVTNVPLEEANPVQIQVAVQEAIYEETERKEPIGAFVILGGDPYDRIKNYDSAL